MTKYPGRIIKSGEADHDIVATIIARLAKLGFAAPLKSVGYDDGLTALVSLFQSQRRDTAGNALVADGEIGSLTWGALFGATTDDVVPGGIAAKALEVAITQIGQLEDPHHPNSGRMVDKYLASVNLDPGYFWCMAFVHYCFMTAAHDAGIANPFPRTAGCLDAWQRVGRATPNRIVTAAQAIADPTRVRPGFVFILDHGHGMGHTGFVRSVTGGTLRTVEGNSNSTGGREGIGVFDLNRRKVTEKGLLGFLDIR